MTHSDTLPASLRIKLTALARRIRWLRLWRGGSWLTLLLVLSFAGVLLADWQLHLTEETLGVLLAGIAILASGLALFGLLLPLCRRLDWLSLAAVVEQHYPELNERLSSSVELATNPEQAHGAPEFVARLLQETDRQTQALNFAQAVSARFAQRLALSAVLATALALLPGLVWSEYYRDFAGRFLLSWFAPPALQMHVAPGDGYAACGRPFTVQMILQRRDERIAWPKQVHLLLIDAAGQAQRLPMTSTGPGAFAWNIERVTGDFRYQLEAGSFRSAEHHIIAIEPVALAPDSPTFTITPPPYMNAEVHPPRLLTASQDISALQFSQLRGQFCFTRSAVLVQATVKAEDSEAKTVWTGPVELSEAASTGTLTLPMLGTGRYRLYLHMEVEQHIATEQELGTLSIHDDQPPEFANIPGTGQRSVVNFKDNTSESLVKSTRITPSPLTPHPGVPERGEPSSSPRSGTPGRGVGGEGDRYTAPKIAAADALVLEATVTDAEGLDRVELEYRINKGAVQSTILSRAEGASEIQLRQRFWLKGKVNEGDVLAYRLKATDRRAIAAGAYRDVRGQPIPQSELHPHVVYYPPTGPGQEPWLLLRVESQGEPLENRDLLAQHAAIHKQLEAIKNRLHYQRNDLLKFDGQTRNRAGLTPGQNQDLDKLWQNNRRIRDDLSKLVRELGQTPELQALQQQLAAVAAAEISQANEALQSARRGREQPQARQKHLDKADLEWVKALSKLDPLQQANQEMALQRLEQRQLEQLADREADLGRQVAELEKQDVQNDSQMQAELAKLQAEQEQVNQQMQQLAQSSKLLAGALQQFQAEKAQMLAQQAEHLARQQQALAAKAEKAQQERLRQLLADFARRQEKLAAAAKQLAQTTAKESQTRDVPLLKPQPAEEAAFSLRHGQPMPALQQQEQAAQELDRVADGLELSLDPSLDPRTALRQLIAWQQKLEDRLMAEAAQVARKTPQQLMDTLQEIHKGQKRIRQGAQKLMLPFRGEMVQKMFEEARDKADETVRFLGQLDPLHAHETMQETRKALEQLVQRLPAAKPRLLPEMAEVDSPAKQQAGQLRELASAQRQLREELQQLLARGAPEQGGGSEKAPGTLAQEQEKMQQAADKLNQDLQQLAQLPGDSEKAKMAAEQAAKLGAEARQAMKQSAAESMKGNAASAKAAAEKAAEKLTKAAMQVKEAALELARNQPKMDTNDLKMQAGQEFQKGQQQARLAQQQLQQKQPAAASMAMQKAAQSLQRAAGNALQQMQARSPQSKPGKGGKQPATAANMPAGSPDLARLVPDLQKYDGQTWGQLPGELRTRILSDMRAQYGAAYAGIIQRYFEQIADTQRKSTEK